MADRTERVRNIKAVLFEEAGAWSAQCLDFDIAAQAETLLDVRDELARVLAVHVAASAQMGREPFPGIAPAPLRFWDLYESGLPVESRSVSYRLDNGPKLPPITPDLRVARSLAV